ncbi:MAG: 30S ribosomal protein S16 [Candidatus Moranbacteria bacterium]|nr:30S ribosomal protein S16 [Candidatus Moranbacteria bacterium]
MLIIRLKRIGKKNKPYYRMVVADKKRAVSGKFIETLGSVDPHLKTNVLNKERILHWIGVGSQVSDSAFNVLVKEQVVKAPKRKINVSKKKKKEGQEAEKKEQAPQEIPQKEAADESKEEPKTKEPEAQAKDKAQKQEDTKAPEQEKKQESQEKAQTEPQKEDKK